MAKASAKVVFSFATRNKFWLGMTISVSTVCLQIGDALLGDAHAPLSLELERLRHHADREDAHLARHLGDDRCGARARAPAHAGGDEGHMRAHEVIADFLHHLLGGGADRPRDGSRRRAPA